jgi:transposase
MITKHEYTKIRRMYFRDDLAINDIARKTCLTRNTVKKWLRAPHDTPPKYSRKPSEKKIKPFETWLLKALEIKWTPRSRQ